MLILATNRNHSSGTSYTRHVVPQAVYETIEQFVNEKLVQDATDYTNKVYSSVDAFDFSTIINTCLKCSFTDMISPTHTHPHRLCVPVAPVIVCPSHITASPSL